MTFSGSWKDIHCELEPVEFKVVVLPDKADQYADEGKLIEKPMQRIEQEQRAMVRGTLIACGKMSFTDWIGTIPKPGDRVFYAQYAGIFTDIEAPNGVVFRIMNDKDICAIIK